jgi:outer membrane protein assembly factor BamB
MKRSLVMALILMLSGWCLAADWPRWRGPDGTGHVPAGIAVPKTLPAEPQVVWHVKIGDGLGSPVVSGGKVFYLDNQKGKETVHAADAATGTEAWSVPLDEVHKDFQSSPGPRSTPVADGDRVYVQSCRGEFQCLNAADGKVLWRVSFVKDFGALFSGEIGLAVGASRHGYTGSAVVDGDHIIVGVGGVQGASVVCFDKKDGKVLWKSQNDVPGYGGPVLATIGGTKQVVSFTSEAVIGLDPADGKLLWRSPAIKTAFARHVTTPVVVDDMVIVASHEAGLLGFRVTKDGDAFKAERAWVQKPLACNFASPVAVEGQVYGLGTGNTLFCADARTGDKAWANDSFFSGMLEKGYASFLVMNDTILVLAEKGQLFLVAADPKECRVISKAKACEKNLCNPAYVDGKLYVRDAQELRCLQLMP